MRLFFLIFGQLNDAFMVPKIKNIGHLTLLMIFLSYYSSIYFSHKYQNPNAHKIKYRIFSESILKAINVKKVNEEKSK
jgi:hypothetical protein